MTDSDPIQLPLELLTLSNLIEEKLEYFASGCQDIHTAALNATKFVFDLSIKSETESMPYINDLLSSLAPEQAPQTRSQTRANGKRKRSPSPPSSLKAVFETTPLTSLFIEGMDVDQIWAQLDLRANKVCELLDLALDREPGEDIGEESDGEDEDERDDRPKRALDALATDREVDFGEDEMGEDEDDTIEDEGEGEDSEASQSGHEELQERVMELRASSSDEDVESEEDSEQEDVTSSSSPNAIRRKPPLKSKKSRTRGHPELDDGFFELTSFNVETEQAEARSSSKGHLGEDGDSSDDDVSIDLFASLDQTEHFEEDDLENDPDEPFYRDFFEPPPRVASSGNKPKTKVHSSPKNSGKVRFHEEVRVKTIKAKGKNLPLSTLDQDDDDAENDDFGEDYSLPSDEDKEQHAKLSESEENDSEDEGQWGRNVIEMSKDDLFAEDEDNLEQDLSTHQQRMAALREQIAELESENVGPKDWVLMGEAGSRTRPQNSLLEEDLEFERVMKAVPVITETTVQALEERIKARMLEGRFDDVIRIRPLEDKPFLPSRFFELKDTKSTQSLAQIYEDEYIATQSGTVAGEDRDGKLKKEHDEIEKLWESICGKLDALCNAHFTPKQPKATISTIPNVSTVTLESALPTTKSAASMLAPEEVFTPSSSNPRSRSELTPAEKRALRSKERKAKKKSRDALEKSVDKYAKVKGIGGIKKQKQAALETVVKSGKGVTVVGKKKKDKNDRRSRT